MIYVTVMLQGQKNSPNLVVYNPNSLLLTQAKCSTFALFTMEFVRGRTHS